MQRQKSSRFLALATIFVGASGYCIFLLHRCYIILAADLTTFPELSDDEIERLIQSSLAVVAVALMIPTLISVRYAAQMKDGEKPLFQYVFELVFSIVGVFVLGFWCLFPDTPRAEPLFVAVGVAFGLFEYISANRSRVQEYLRRMFGVSD